MGNSGCCTIHRTHFDGAIDFLDPLRPGPDIVLVSYSLTILRGAVVAIARPRDEKVATAGFEDPVLLVCCATSRAGVWRV